MARLAPGQARKICVLGRAQYELQRGVWGLALVLLASACAGVPPAGQAPGAQQAAIPAAWIDLPESPFLAVISDGAPSLVNRTDQSIDFVSIGCVRTAAGVVEIVGNLFSSGISDGAWTRAYPNRGALDTLISIYRDPSYFASLRPPVLPCPAGSRISVTAASNRVGYQWSAAGTKWPDR
jgi:hypothetical protein